MLKFQMAFETECYIGETGYFVIKQIDTFGEETQVLLSPDQAKKLSSYIVSWTDEACDVFYSSETEAK